MLSFSKSTERRTGQGVRHGEEKEEKKGRKVRQDEDLKWKIGVVDKFLKLHSITFHSDKKTTFYIIKKPLLFYSAEQKKGTKPQFQLRSLSKNQLILSKPIYFL